MKLSALFILAMLYFGDSPIPTFEPQVIDANVAIGYGLAIGDVDGDRKPDILLADKKQFVWYRNGDWKRFVMVDNLTESDNVCIAARDIDGDGKVEVAVGAQWSPGETSDTLKSGSVHYLVRPKDPTQLWTPVKLHHEPTIHRMKWMQVAKGKFQLIVVPLHGRGNKNGEGAGVRVFAYEKPADPTKKWTVTLIDESMHLTHNLELWPSKDFDVLFIGGKEGIKSFQFKDGKWTHAHPIAEESFGELRLASGIVAAIQPMHGNTLSLYSGPVMKRENKQVLSSSLNQGHALAIADVVAGGSPEIVVGWREPDADKKVGIKIFSKEGNSWNATWLDDNGMACEDLQVADLDGNGKLDVIAAGRATHNLKIYWNR